MLKEVKEIGNQEELKSKKRAWPAKFCSKSEPLRKCPPPGAKWFRSRPSSSAKILAVAKRPLGTRVPIFRNGLRKSHSSAKPFPHCKNGLQASKWLRKCSRHQNGLRNSHLAAKCFRSPIATPCEITLGLQKTFFFIPFGCKMTSKLRNDLQAIKMTCKMKRGLQKHFAKPREVAKMPIKPCNHASKEESPLTENTHMKPLTPFQTSLNHQSP